MAPPGFYLFIYFFTLNLSGNSKNLQPQQEYLKPLQRQLEYLWKCPSQSWEPGQTETAVNSHSSSEPVLGHRAFGKVFANMLVFKVKLWSSFNIAGILSLTTILDWNLDFMVEFKKIMTDSAELVKFVLSGTWMSVPNMASLSAFLIKFNQNHKGEPYGAKGKISGCLSSQICLLLIHPACWDISVDKWKLASWPTGNVGASSKSGLHGCLYNASNQSIE